MGTHLKNVRVLRKSNLATSGGMSLMTLLVDTAPPTIVVVKPASVLEERSAALTQIDDIVSLEVTMDVSFSFKNHTLDAVMAPPTRPARR